MKRVISLVLSFVMLFSITAGIDLSAIASEDDYKEIWTADDLYLINANLSGNYRLMADIDLKSYTSNWESIAGNSVYGYEFKGVFDGNNHTITGMRINSYNDLTILGLFRVNSGIIKNLYMKNSSIRLEETNAKGAIGWFALRAGSICGYNYGDIINCHVINSDIKVSERINIDGSSHFDAYAGGITASNYGNIQCCSSIGGTITAETAVNYSNQSYRTAYAGGICATSTKTIEQCFNTSEISCQTGGQNSNYYKSGICGKSDSEISFINSYSTQSCSLSKARLSYCDGAFVDKNGNIQSLTKSQMKLQELYLTFDFDNIWIMDKGTDYPYPQLRNNRQDTVKKIEQIEITIPENIDYHNVNKDNLIVKVIYANGNSEIISDYDILISEEGTENIITVSYYGTEETLTITVHKPASEWKITKKADCENDGEKTLNCSVCGKVLDSEIIPATGHKEVIDIEAKTATCTESGNTVGSHCSVCNKILKESKIINPLKHSYQLKITPPTCEGQGYTTYLCTRCGDTYISDYTLPAGHKFVTLSGYPATCTENGLTDGSYCSVCNKTIEKQVVIYAKGHNKVVDKAVEPTCTATGLTEGRHCSVCGETIVEQNVINAKGHKFDGGKITKNASCTENGVKTYTCTVCGDFYTEEIPKLPHTAVIDKAVEPTCTATGLTEGSHCSVCGGIIVEQKEITMLPHTAKWNNESGFIVKKCTVCNEELSRLQFEDLGEYTFYGDYVEYTSVNNKFISGTNPPLYTQFSPKTPITRAMFVAILYRMAGNPYDSANPYTSNPFSDVSPSAYYYNAACWALDNDITNQTTFKPNNNVTREQAARFLFAYAESKGLLGDEAYKNVNLGKYPDYNSVHSWAVEPLQWANYNDMITGTQQGYINPQGATQRIHATRILYGFGKACNIGNFE